MSKQKHYVIFNENTAIIKTNEDIRIWQKDSAINVIDYKRSNGIVKKANKFVDDHSVRYNFYIDDYILKVKFFTVNSNINKEFEERVENLYQIDRNKMKLRLKYISIIIALAFSSGVLLSKPVKEIIEQLEIFEETNDLETNIEEDKQLIK